MNRMTKMASTTEIIRSRAQCATDPRTERLSGTGGIILGAVLTAEGVSCWSISYVISKWISNTIFTPAGPRSKQESMVYSRRLKEKPTMHRRAQLLHAAGLSLGLIALAAPACFA